MCLKISGISRCFSAIVMFKRIPIQSFERFWTSANVERTKNVLQTMKQCNYEDPGDYDMDEYDD